MHLGQWFPIFFHLRTPWQTIFINCTLYISKIFVINIADVFFLIYILTYVPFPAIIQFFRIPLNVLLHTYGVRVPQIWNH
jgi:hypothetical protein